MDTVVELSKKLRNGKIDAVDLTETVLENITGCKDQAIFIDILTYYINCANM